MTPVTSRFFSHQMLEGLSKFSYRSVLLMALIAGALNLFAFAPFYCWPIQIASLAFVLLLVQQRQQIPLWRQTYLFWAYGFAWLASGFGWLVIALARYGDLPWVLSVIAIGLLAGLLAIYLAAGFYVARYLQKRWQVSDQLFLLLLFPSMFVLAEWLRAWVLTGFPWASSGYVHTVSWLAGFAPLIGVYGIGWLNALLAAALCAAIVSRQQIKGSLILALTLFSLGYLLQQISWTSPMGKPIQVRLLQGNIDQGVKFDAAHFRETLNLYRSLLTQNAADLIATPETAFPVVSSELPGDYLENLQAFAKQTQSQLVLGVVLHDGANRYSNSVVGLGSTASVQGYRYDKHHLVPFGEFIPTGFRWFTNLLQIPLGDLSSAGLYQTPLQVKDQYVMPNICYEDVFGEEIAAQLLSQHRAGLPVASILLNVSNLAWYGDSTAIPQHLQISTMRVLETGRPMLRSTNTGATAAIDGRGHLIAELKPLTRGSLDVAVQGMQGITPYILFGNHTILLIIVSCVLVAFFVSRKNR